VTPDTDLFSSAPIGIPIALVGAVILALGAQFQHAGVTRVDDPDDGAPGLSVGQLVALLKRPSWVIGTLLLGLATVFQLTSLYFAPLIVVQPLGAIGLIVTAIINSRVSKVNLDRYSIRAIAFCVGGVALFVTIAAFTAKEKPISESELILVLSILGTIILLFALALVLFRKRFTAILYILSGGILFGFVATLAKVVIARIKTLFSLHFQTGHVEWLTIGCVALLIVAALLGSYFVQSAYANGPPDLVVAGLTVIDPAVAILISIVVLGEASDAPIWAIPAFLVAAGLAIYGVFQLAKHHPQLQR
jgi:Magnesium transporter NIPA